MAVTGFWHAGITVSDMERSLRFYRDGLGLEVVGTGTSSSSAERTWAIPGARATIVFVQVPGSQVTLELVEFLDIERHPASARPVDPAHGHVCLYVDDLSAMHTALVSQGFRGRANEVVEIPDGPFAGAKVIYMKDPDGYHVELFEAPAAR